MSRAKDPATYITPFAAALGAVCTILGLAASFGGLIYSVAAPHELSIVRAAFIVAGLAGLGLATCAVYYRARAQDLDDAEAEARHLLAEIKAEYAELVRLNQLATKLDDVAGALIRSRRRRLWLF